MYEVDFARGLAYKGMKGFVIKYTNGSAYVMDQGEQIFLTEENTIIMEVENAVTI